MVIEYCVVSKDLRNYGRLVLQSFASRELWKNYEQIRRQSDTISHYNKKTAMYALNKYANKDTFEVIAFSIIVTEFNKYCHEKI